MSLFSLFKKDPAEQLVKARRLLEAGEGVRALRLASRLAAEDSLHADKAAALVEEARTEVIRSARERADQAVKEGYLEDALEWLRGGLEHAGDGQREVLEEEMARLRTALAARQDEEALEPEPAVVPEPAEEPYALDADEYFDTLVGTLSDELVEVYSRQPTAFQEAVVALNGGDPEGALESLEGLVEATPEEPILRLERGRCHLMLGRGEEAQRDFEAAWPALGDESLDRLGQLSVPLLWAEALLAQNRPWPILERLKDAARPERGNVALTAHYAQALLDAEQWEAARDFLAQASAGFPGQPLFPYQLAETLRRLGQGEVAIDYLEVAVAPSCATGNCSRPAMHLPSMHLLTDLYLDKGDLNRVRELMELTTLAQQGRRGREDYRLLARYHEARGEKAEAERAAAEADRLKTLEGREELSGESTGGVAAANLGQGQAAL